MSGAPGWLRDALIFDPSALIEFHAGGRRVGWVRRDFATELARWPAVFRLTDHLAFAPGLDDAARRSAGLARVLAALREAGRLRGWRDECYRVPPRGDGPELFRMERAARRRFGIQSHAVHVNGWTRGPAGEPCLWVGRRSPSKSVDPDRWDNLVAGGIAADSDAVATLVKECFEEAGVDAALARRAVHAGTLAFARDDPEGVDAQRIEIHDLELPPDWMPRNQDGEVAGFRRLSIDAVRDLLDVPGAFTVDAALVTLDALARRGE